MGNGGKMRVLEVGFRDDNTEGYTQAQLDTFNAELITRLEGIEPHSDEWYRVAKQFADEVAGR